MSDISVLDHGYVPEEHAPDPVIGHGDPTPPGKVAIWLFLASEVMFFIAILGTYIILRSGSPELFRKFATVLSVKLAGVNTLVLILSSLTMALAVDAAKRRLQGRTVLCLLITFVCAGTFMVIKGIEYHDKWVHHTIVYRTGSPSSADPAQVQLNVFDGHVLADDGTTMTVRGPSMPIAEHGQFDIHQVTEEDILSARHETAEPANPPVQANADKHDEPWTISKDSVVEDINYLPYKNVFYASYFTLTGVHGIHVLGGMVPIFILMIQALRGKLFGNATEYVGLYWHFVDLVWIFLFPLLYLI